MFLQERRVHSRRQVRIARAPEDALHGRALEDPDAHDGRAGGARAAEDSPPIVLVVGRGQAGRILALDPRNVEADGERRRGVLRASRALARRGDAGDARGDEETGEAAAEECSASLHGLPSSNPGAGSAGNAVFGRVPSRRPGARGGGLRCRVSFRRSERHGVAKSGKWRLVATPARAGRAARYFPSASLPSSARSPANGGERSRAARA